MSSLAHGLTPDQVKTLFGAPDKIESDTYGINTPDPWQALVYVYVMPPDQSAPSWNRERNNKFVFSQESEPPRLSYWTIKTSYPDELVPDFSKVPKALEVANGNTSEDQDLNIYKALLIAQLTSYANWDMSIVDSLAEGDLTMREWDNYQKMNEMLTVAHQQTLEGKYREAELGYQTYLLSITTWKKNASPEASDGLDELPALIGLAVNAFQMNSTDKCIEHLAEGIRIMQRNECPELRLCRYAMEGLCEDSLNPNCAILKP